MIYHLIEKLGTQERKHGKAQGSLVGHNNDVRLLPVMVQTGNETRSTKLNGPAERIVAKVSNESSISVRVRTKA